MRTTANDGHEELVPKRSPEEPPVMHSWQMKAKNLKNLKSYEVFIFFLLPVDYRCLVPQPAQPLGAS